VCVFVCFLISDSTASSICHTTSTSLSLSSRPSTSESIISCWAPTASATNAER